MINQNIYSQPLLEIALAKAIKLIPIRRGKVKIVDFLRKLLDFSEGSMRQAVIDNDIPIIVDLFERIQSYMYFIGEYEKWETKKFKENLRLGNVVLDIGANIGYFSLIASKIVGKAGLVFAFEASPKVYEQLYQNCYLSSKKKYFSS